MELPALSPAQWNAIATYLTGDGLTEGEDFNLEENPDHQTLVHTAHAGQSVWQRLVELDAHYLTHNS